MWSRGKDQQLLAELPAAYATQKHYLALTVASGDEHAGLQAGEVYFYWKNYGKRLAFVTPSLDIRSSGDKASQDSIKRLFTDRVLLDVPVITMIPQGGPIIDLDELVIQHAEKLFGLEAKGLNKGIYTIKSAKACPSNIEISVEGPTANGQLRTFHYSFSLIPDNTGYQPRLADERIGFQNAFDEPAWPVHDKVLGTQASAMTSLLNPVTLARVYDNEFRTPAKEDAVTLPEVLQTVSDAAWTELSRRDPAKAYNDRNPLVSSLRRTLQREHVERLIDLANNKLGNNPAPRLISDLAAGQLADLRDLTAGAAQGNLDAYIKAHFRENAARITKLRDSRYVVSP